MKSSIKINNNLNIISEMENESKFQILEYDSLKGVTDLKSSMAIKSLNQSGITLKQVRVLLNDTVVKLQTGALSYMKGNIKIKSNIEGPVSLGKRLFAKRIVGEDIIKPTFEGSGEIYLEPSFQHFTLIELFDEEIILDDDLFYACEEDIYVSISVKKNISSILFGESGLFEVKLKGSGIVVLKLPVPEKEIFRCKLINEKLTVDGDFAILRSGSINFSIEKSGSTLVGSILNGEGLVSVFEGVGEVWLLPTGNIYEELKEEDLEEDLDQIVDDEDN